MFQRLKGSLDRVIAEEQARQKAANEQAGAGSNTGSPRQSSSVSRSNSAASTARKPRPKKQSQDVSKNDDGAANLDPAVFEAAFVIDDDEPSRATTPKPPTDDQAPQNGDAKDAGSAGGDSGPGAGAGDSAQPGQDAEARAKDDEQKPAPPPKNEAPELPPDVRTRLRKLEKLEATYPGWFTSRYATRSCLRPQTWHVQADLLHRIAPLLPHRPQSSHLHRAFRTRPSREHPSHIHQRPNGVPRISQPAESQGRHGHGGVQACICREGRFQEEV